MVTYCNKNLVTNKIFVDKRKINCDGYLNLSILIKEYIITEQLLSVAINYSILIDLLPRNISVRHILENSHYDLYLLELILQHQ